jgi:thioredoxin-related protein
MKYTLLLIMSILMQFSMAQEKGIKFENGQSWSQIKEKAKKENKYIFLDGYTTWCVPCKKMNMDVFPQPDVGSFFNQNFINVAVQFDITLNDNDEVKSWYNDARGLHETYKIDSYPTYLFFNPDGNLVHVIKGANPDAKDFIVKAKQALDINTQYISLKNQYTPSVRDSVFLLNLINAAIQSGDGNSLPVFINTYLTTQKDLFTARNLKFIANATTKSSDIGYVQKALKWSGRIVKSNKENPWYFVTYS